VWEGKGERGRKREGNWHVYGAWLKTGLTRWRISCEELDMQTRNGGEWSWLSVICKGGICAQEPHIQLRLGASAQVAPECCSQVLPSHSYKAWYSQGFQAHSFCPSSLRCLLPPSPLPSPVFSFLGSACLTLSLRKPWAGVCSSPFVCAKLPMLT
jgi:hypothetical protein